jgi:hypothetical protein
VELTRRRHEPVRRSGAASGDDEREQGRQRLVVCVVVREMGCSG